MTSSIKDSADANNLGKQGTQPQAAAGKPPEGARTNPVCLELGVTIRSLPAENGGLAKPVRLDGRTVIVFDQGAVLRCAENLPVGQTFILSNPNGRDVVCMVASGRNLPSVKGYVEVQFMEPVNDFWGIHEVAAVPVAAVKTPEVRREVAQPAAIPAPLPAAPKLEAPAKPAKVQADSAPSFDDIGGLLTGPAIATTPERKTAPVKPPYERVPSSVSAYSQSENASQGFVANLTSSEADQAAEKNAKQAVTEALSNALTSGPISSSHAIPSSNIFSSRGILAQSQSEAKPAALGGRMPIVAGAIVLVLAGVGAGVFFMHRGSEPVPAAMTTAVSQPVAAPPSAAANVAANAPATDAVTTEEKGQLPAQNVDVEPSPAGAAASAIPAVVSNAVSNESNSESKSESKLDQKETRRPESAASSRAPSATPAPRRPSIANLKMSSPSAPHRASNDVDGNTAAMTDMVATQPVGAGTAPVLLTASGRTSTQPVAPPGAMASAPAAVPAPLQAAAVKTVAPKLISSVRLTYPPSARQSGIQGSVTVLANVEANGTVSSVKALNGPMLLRQAAVDSVKQWKYSPGLADGRPAAAQVTVAVEFKLN